MNSENQANTEPTPKTTAQLGDSIWAYYQSLNGSSLDDVLSDLLTAGKLELAIEFLKLKEFERIADDIEEIRLTLDGAAPDISSLTQAVCGIASGM